MVKLRLARRGRKKLSMFDIVVSDARAPRDGKFIEKIGTYNPATNPASILIYKGIMYKRHLQIGVDKGALTQEAADAKLADWLKAKEASIQSKISGLSKSKEDQAKARKAAESKVREARAEAIRKKAEVAVAAPEGEAAEGETPAAEAQA